MKDWQKESARALSSWICSQPLEGRDKSTLFPFAALTTPISINTSSIKATVSFQPALSLSFKCPTLPSLQGQREAGCPLPLSDPHLTVNSHLQINYLALEEMGRRRKRQQSNKTSSDRRNQCRWARDKDLFWKQQRPHASIILQESLSLGNFLFIEIAL